MYSNIVKLIIQATEVSGYPKVFLAVSMNFVNFQPLDFSNKGKLYSIRMFEVGNYISTLQGSLSKRCSVVEDAHSSRLYTIDSGAV